MDDFGAKINLEHLKVWWDRYSTNVEVKGGHVALAATTFLVTSNKSLMRNIQDCAANRATIDVPTVYEVMLLLLGRFTLGLP